MTEQVVTGSPGVTWPSTAAELSLRRLAGALGALWLAVELAALMTAPTGVFRPAWPVFASMAVALAAGVAVAVRPRLDVRVFLVATGVACALALALLDRGSAGEAGVVVFWLPNVFVVALGLLQRRSVAAPAVLAAVAATGAAVFLGGVLAPGASGDAARTALTAMCFGLWDGVATVLVAGALRATAAVADTELTRAEAERFHAEVLLARRREAARVAAWAHDGVINTLSAVATNGDVLDADLVAEICAKESAAVRRGSARRVEPAGAREDVLAALAGDGGPSLYPVVRYRGPAPDVLARALAELPAEVADALCGGVHEALVNVARHSEVGEADVEVHLGPGGGSVRITVRDAGRGFDGRLRPGRGTGLSIAERCAAAGVRAQVSSVPGEGTTVRLGWTPPADRGAGPSSGDIEAFLREACRAFGQGIALCMLALCASLSLLVEGLSPSWGTTTALVVLVVVVVAARPGSAGGTAGTTTQVLLVAAVAAAVLLPANEVPGCDRLAAAWWGTDGALVPLVLLVFLTRSAWPAVAGLAVFWLSVVLLALSVGIGRCGSGAIVSGLLDAAVVVALLLFRRRLAAVARGAAASGERARQARLRTAVLESSQAAWRAELDEALERAVAVLDRLAARRLAPDDPQVRRTCRTLESHLREVTQLDPGLGDLGDALAACLAEAGARGVRLVLRIGADDLPDGLDPTVVGDLLREVVRAAATGETVTVSRFGGGTAPDTELTLVVPHVPGRVVPGTDAVRSAGWQVSVREAGDRAIVALRPQDVPERSVPRA